MTTAEFRGRELEEAYARVFKGRVIGGFNDRGLDVLTNDGEIPVVQCKGCMAFAKQFLAESFRRKRFIPLCIGAPGAREEILASLRKFGAWIGRDIDRRHDDLANFSRMREICQRRSP